VRPKFTRGDQAKRHAGRIGVSRRTDVHDSSERDAYFAIASADKQIVPTVEHFVRKIPNDKLEEYKSADRHEKRDEDEKDIADPSFDYQRADKDSEEPEPEQRDDLLD
jgi:hypothetical protein